MYTIDQIVSVNTNVGSRNCRNSYGIDTDEYKKDVSRQVKSFTKVRVEPIGIASNSRVVFKVTANDAGKINSHYFKKNELIGVEYTISVSQVIYAECVNSVSCFA
jgi:hypothetical protein